jgi:AmiR/NasT family two-component response regulator
VRAVFGFPLLTGNGPLGALDLYLDRPGSLDDRQMDEAAVLAKVISSTVLSLQSEAAPGELGEKLGASLDHRAVVHQASGMVSAQLDIDVNDALVRLRAYAYTSNRPVNEVARAIVTRQLRLG